MGALGLFEQAAGVFGFELADADPQKESRNRANHFVEEPLPFNTDLHIAFPQAGDGDLGHRFHGSANLALRVRGEGREIVLADQRFRREFHGVQIERAAFVQAVEAKLRRNGGAVPDEVAVFLARCIEASVKVVFNLLKLHDAHIGIQNRVEAGLEFGEIHRLIQIKMGDLPFGVNPGIRAARMMNPNLFSDQNL